ncbi:hypothetical protein V6N13_059301 [Hibiscus sabdariffa]
MVHDNWISSSNMTNTVTAFAKDADTWNKTVFGYIRTKKLQSNSLRVIKLIQDHAVDSSSSPFVREIWELIRRPWRTLFTWVPREGNLAADALAKQPSLPNYSMQRYEAPDFLQAVLRRDIHGPH